MSQDLKSGSRWQSVVCSGEVVIVKAPSAPVVLTIGGVEAVLAGSQEASGAPAEGHEGGTQVGKRYEHGDSGLEVLCTKAGAGSIAVDGQILDVKGAQALPSSD